MQVKEGQTTIESVQQTLRILVVDVQTLFLNKNSLSLDSWMKLGLLTGTRQQSSFICSLSWVGSLTEDTAEILILALWFVCLFVCLHACIH